MSDAYNHAPPFVVETPLGPIDVDIEAYKNAVLYVNHQTGYDLQDRQIDEFIGSNSESKAKEFSGRSMVGWIHSLVSTLENDFELVRATNYNNRGSAESNPVYLDEKVRLRGGNEKTIKIPHRQSRYYRHRAKDYPLVVTFYPYDTYEMDVRFYFSTTSDFDYTDFMDNVKTHFKTEGIYKKAAINADFTYLDVPDYTWEDIIISEEQKSQIDRNAISFLARMEQYQSMGMKTSRGILLKGPPGTGKTLCCSVLMNYCRDSTIIYVSRNAVTERGQIDDIYKVARMLSPTLVVVEDIDTLGGIDREEGDHPLLGEFLNCLAGVEQNDQVITLATTNYANHLDWALADRPGRFDARVAFDHPDQKARTRILSKYLGYCECEALDIGAIAKKTEGWSGAYLRELVNVSIMLSADDGAVIKQSHLDGALEELNELRNIIAQERGRKRKEDTNESYFG